jgi:hypothetical protein
MDARHGSLRARTAMVLLACAFFALPEAEARGDTPPEASPEPSALVLEQQSQPTSEPPLPTPVPPTPVPPESVVEPPDAAPAPIADGAEEQPGAEAADPVPELTLEAEREPLGEAGPAPMPAPASTLAATEDVPVLIPAPPEVSEPEVRVVSRPAPPARDRATADRGRRLLTEVEVRLRRVEHSTDRVKSELDAGRAPTNRLLRELHQNVEALAPAAGALARYMASHPSHDLDVVGVERRLRRAIAVADLVTEVARSGVDTPESGLLARALEGFAGARATMRLPAHTGKSVAASRAGGAAYTHPAPGSAQSWSGIASEVPYRAAIAGSAASTNLSLGFAALALLLAVSVSASLSSFLLSGWGLERSTTAPSRDA